MAEITNPPRKTIPPERRAPIEAAINEVGGKQEMVRQLNARGWEIASDKVVHQWLLNGVPARYCPDIEALTGIPCESLCPDVKWGLVRNRRLKARA
jgi:DNA-binding transcriptional regulator YdaS (Cro superfamily)